MEAIEMPMTRGVAAPINAQPTPIRADIGPEISETGGSVVESSFVQEELPEQEHIVEENGQAADELLDSAKSDGFEKTLQDLADGEFDDVEEDKKTPLEEKFEKKDEVAVINEELKDVEERVGKVESDYLSKEAFAEAMLIAALLKKEEDPEEKMSLYELLVLAMSKLFIELASNDSEPEKAKPARKTEKKKPVSILDVKKRLYAQGLLRSNPVENQAA